MHIKDFKRKFDKQFNSLINDKIKESRKILSRPRVQKIIDYVHVFIFSGGKRIRPYLTYLSYTSLGGQNTYEIMKLGRIWEMLHTMALIHDDIIDKGEKRHGVDTAHRFIEKLCNNSKNAEHLGISQALLLGDLLLCWTYELLHQKYEFKSDDLMKAIRTIHNTIEQLTLGQMIDVDMMVGDQVEKEKLEKKNYYKSAIYTFSKPLVVGAMVAGATKTLCKNFQTIGEHLGAAYQIRDDLLDIILNTGDETSHYDDKTKFSDIQEGQQTFFTHYILEQDNKKHIKTLERCWGKELSQEDITKLQEIFVSSGAIEYGKKLIDFHLNKATKLINTLPIIDESYRGYYYEIINLLKKL